MKPKNYFLCAILMMATMFALHAQVHYQIPAVGAIPGEINVSSMGTASYTIPIEVVPGTQGLEPNLSIVYNSSGGMGLLGMKWSLSGISAVTRCNRTPYHDDELAYFFFGNQDRFALNGERLVQISDGNYGWNGEEHATEVENYSRVISYGNHNPPYYYYYHFIEYNDDGTVAEYGNTSDSKQSVAIGEHFGFYIQKVTDADGNYMTYHYNNDKEKLIQEIHYTGNNNSRMETYAKVTFSYISNNINPNSYFVYKQYHIPQTKLLKTITVTGQNGFVRKYTFHYAHENVSGETTSHLTKIVLSGENDREIGATTITWGEPNDNPTNNVITLSNLPKGKTVTGDFNGDGYQDIIVYGQTGNIWKLYTHTPNTQNFVETTIQGTHCHLHDFDYYPSLPLKYHYKVSTCDFYSADVNGDGYDELVIVEKQPMLDINYFLFSHYSSICRIYSLKNGVTLLDTKTFSPFTELQQLVFGDFDGSGSTDIMYVKDKYTSPISFYSSSTNYTDTMLTAKGIPIGNATPMVPCYFNGDSRANVLINAGETWWENVFIDSYNQKLKKFMNFFSNSGARFDYLTPHIFPGDFNGDGTTDFLTFDTLKNWKVYTGGFYYKNNISLNISLENIASEYPNPKYLPIIADINGDGKDDIIQITPYQYNKTKVKIIYMKGWVPNNFITEVEEKIIDGNFVDKNYAVIDLYNDGFLDLLVYDTVAKKHKVICLHKNKEYNYVQKITDGFEKEILLTYDFKYMDMEMVNATKSFYKKVFFPVISSLKISNGLENNLNEIEYQYQNLVYSASKRALMGFKNFEEKNVVENKKDSYIFPL